MSVYEKEIRQKWSEFRKWKGKQQRIYIKKEDISKVFSKIFN